MDSPFVIAEVRRATRNLVRVNGAIVVLALLVVAATATYWRNVWQGPYPMGGRALVVMSTEDVAQLSRYFVTVEGRPVGGAVDHGDWRWILIEIEGRLLAVKTFQNAALGTSFSGVLSEMSNDVRADVLPKFYARDGSLEPRVLPFYLSADAFGPNGRQLTWGLIGVVVIALWNLRNARVRWRAPKRHPSVRGLARFGDVDEVVAAIDREVGACGPEGNADGLLGAKDKDQSSGTNLLIGENKDKVQASDTNLLGVLGERRFRVTVSWLLTRETFGFTAWRLDGLLWACEAVDSRPIVGSMTSTLRVHARDGSAAMFGGTSSEVAEALDDIRCMAPWVVIGMDDRVAKLWQSDRAQLIAEVEGRRPR